MTSGNVVGGPCDGDTWQAGDHDRQMTKLRGYRYYWDMKTDRWRCLGHVGSMK